MFVVGVVFVVVSCWVDVESASVKIWCFDPLVIGVDLETSLKVCCLFFVICVVCGKLVCRLIPLLGSTMCLTHS